MHEAVQENLASSNDCGFEQGAVVEFRMPNAIEPEPSFFGPQHGIVISTRGYAQSSGCVCVCPFVPSVNPVIARWSIKVLRPGDSEVYLRPDLTSFVGTNYVKPVTSQNTGEALIWPSSIVRRAVNGLLTLIQPSETKLQFLASNGFLRYGEMDWFKDMPCVEKNHVRDAPAVCLTPSIIYRETGLALTLSGRSNIEIFRQIHFVGILTDKFGFSGFSISSLQPISINRLVHTGGSPPVSIGFKALKGVRSKTEAKLSIKHYLIAKRRYSDVPGELPDYIEAALRQEKVHRGHSPQSTRYRHG